MSTSLKVPADNPGDLFDDSLLCKVVGLASLIPSGATFWTAAGTSGDNAAQTVTQAGVAAKRHYVLGYLVRVRGASVVSTTDMTVVLKDGTTAKLTDVIGAGAGRGDGCGVIAAVPLMVATAAADVNLVVAAVGTSGGITEAFVFGYTV